MRNDASAWTGAMDQLVALEAAGGTVMWPLLAVGLLAWTLVVLRVMTLIEIKRAHRGDGQTMAQPRYCVAGALQVRCWKIALRRHAAIIDTLVAAAPLLGLLGTVSGMIATFEGLAVMTLFSEEGGIAGGIAEALTTTQAGLLIAIPVLFANRVIGRKVRKLEQHFDAMSLRTAPTAAGSLPSAWGAPTTKG